MGQSQSQERRARNATPEQLSHELAQRFAAKCFTKLELTHFIDVFRTLADEQDGIKYWKEDTLRRFFSLPDVLGAGPVLYLMATHLGAFPFPSLAPAILTREALVRVVVIMTQRYSKILRHGARDRNKLLFRSLSVFDRTFNGHEKHPPNTPMSFGERDITEGTMPTPRKPNAGFKIDAPGPDDVEEDDDDELALAALDSLDAIEVYKAEQPAKKNQAQIPVDNWRRLVMLLLVVAPVDPQENLSITLSSRVTESRLQGIRSVADSIVWAFAPEEAPGISYKTFMTILSNSLPYFFDGLNALFEHFLFSKNLDLSRHKPSQSSEKGAQEPVPPPPQALPTPAVQPLLPSEGEILDLNVLSQLSFFMRPSSIFRRLRPLYAGGEAGYSINSISQKVLNWQAPSILLVAGTRLPTYSTYSSSSHVDPRERAFIDSLPPQLVRRLPLGANGNSSTGRVVFGAYLGTPWKNTPSHPAGDEHTLLFQLEPIHEVYRASSLNRDYLTMTPRGIGFGVPVPKRTASSGYSSSISLGPVSLFLDGSLEFGVFTHDSSGGGAFATSRTRDASPGWQDRFTIDSVEVWGIGGDDEAERQKQAWQWEEKEAAARRGLNLGRDRDADYALLEMAGLVGGHSNSGGSMG